MNEGNAKCILLCLGVLMLPLLVLGIHLNIHRHNYFAWKERVCSTGPWAGPSVWAGEGDDIYLVSRRMAAAAAR